LCSLHASPFACETPRAQVGYRALPLAIARVPAVERRMPYRTNLELFGPVALAYVIDGPKRHTALDGHVPISVLDHLRSVGMIKRRMLRQGSLATAWWYMADEDAPSQMPP
jgi:hypothetical protein